MAASLRNKPQQHSNLLFGDSYQTLLLALLAQTVAAGVAVERVPATAWSEPVCGRELQLLKSSAFTGHCYDNDKPQDDLMLVCERGSTSSLYPSLILSPDAAVSAPALLFGGLSPTRRQELPLSGRRPRTAQADLGELLQGAGIAAHILRVLHECRSVFATHGMPNPSESYFSFLARVGVRWSACNGRLQVARQFYVDFAS